VRAAVALTTALVATTVTSAVPAAAHGAMAAARAAVAPSPAAPTRDEAWIARLTVPTRPRTTPAGTTFLRQLPTQAPWNGGPMALLVLGVRQVPGRGTWLKVRLPDRPNGSTGWLPQERTDVRATPWRVEVDLSERRVRLLRAGKIVRSSAAVIGAPGTPTPRGLFAVMERVRQPDPKAFLGSWALHLTAFSDVLDDYGGGPGRVALHGRGAESFLDPLGSARSHGCVRLPNAIIASLARHAAAGTPVRIMN
jgi:lipoprotein-anchoring transpeptidase ErfK/SrfK